MSSILRTTYIIIIKLHTDFHINVSNGNFFKFVYFTILLEFPYGLLISFWYYCRLDVSLWINSHLKFSNVNVVQLLKIITNINSFLLAHLSLSFFLSSLKAITSDQHSSTKRSRLYQLVSCRKLELECIFYWPLLNGLILAINFAKITSHIQQVFNWYWQMRPIKA